MREIPPWPTRPVPLAARLRRPNPLVGRASPTVHGQDCPCCEPCPGPADGDVELSGQAIAAWSIAGAATGLALAKIIDWLVAGPGLTAMFGAWS